MVGVPLYFFFAVFFAAFFAGAFLAAFLVAICLFSLFDGLHRVLQHLLQLRKCIDSCGVSVKKKTTMEWKKWQQFLSPFSLAHSLFTDSDASEGAPPLNLPLHHATREQKFLLADSF